MGTGRPEPDDEFEIELDDGEDEEWLEAVAPSGGVSLRAGGTPDLVDVVERVAAGSGFEAEAPAEEMWPDGDPEQAADKWGEGWDISRSNELAKLWSDEPDGPPILPSSLAPMAPPAPKFDAVPFAAMAQNVEHFDEAPIWGLGPNPATEPTQTLTRKPPEVTEPLGEQPEITAPIGDLPEITAPIGDLPELGEATAELAVPQQEEPSPPTPPWMVAAL
ncbi:MAG: hypothetical protein KDA24_29105, partial [Deltaproteobacteria bacterium]|nr:hypothetical protein [Deltaproteobacteria bacterium]